MSTPPEHTPSASSSSEGPSPPIRLDLLATANKSIFHDSPAVGILSPRRLAVGGAIDHAVESSLAFLAASPIAAPNPLESTGKSPPAAPLAAAPPVAAAAPVAAAEEAPNAALSRFSFFVPLTRRERNSQSQPLPPPVSSGGEDEVEAPAAAASGSERWSFGSVGTSSEARSSFGSADPSFGSRTKMKLPAVAVRSGRRLIAKSKPFWQTRPKASKAAAAK